MFQRTEQKVDLAATATTVKDTMNKTVTHVKKMNIFSLASAAVLAVALILAIIGLTGPMYSREEEQNTGATRIDIAVKEKIMEFLFKTTIREYNYEDDYRDKNKNRWCFRRTGKDSNGDKICNKDDDMWMAAYAFAIIGVASVGIALAATLVTELLPGRVPRLASPVFIILAWIALLISWAIVVAKYSNAPLCDPNGTREAPSKLDFDIDYGLGLLIAAWCFVGIAFCVNVGGLVMSMMQNKTETTATNQVSPAATAPAAQPDRELGDVVPATQAAPEVNQAPNTVA